MPKAQNRTKKELEEHLLLHRTIDGNDCWNWTKSVLDRKRWNYGLVGYLGKAWLVHRVAAFLWLGFDLHSKRKVLHKCDNPKCFNPKHLFIGTIADNNRDMTRKGRVFHPFGTINSHAKLDESDVFLIRRSEQLGTPRRMLAAVFGVCKANIGRICIGERWGYLEKKGEKDGKD